MKRVNIKKSIIQQHTSIFTMTETNEIIKHIIEKCRIIMFRTYCTFVFIVYITVNINEDPTLDPCGTSHLFISTNKFITK